MLTFIIFLILGLLVAVAAILFALGNPGIIPITFLFWSGETSLTLVVMVSFGVGLLVMLLILMPGLIGARVREARHKKTINDMRKALPKEEEPKPEKPPAPSEPPAPPAKA